MKTKIKILAVTAAMFGFTALGASALPSGKSPRPLSFHEFGQKQSVATGPVYSMTGSHRTIGLAVGSDSKKLRPYSQRKHGGTAFRHGR